MELVRLFDRYIRPITLMLAATTFVISVMQVAGADRMRLVYYAWPIANLAVIGFVVDMIVRKGWLREEVEEVAPKNILYSLALERWPSLTATQFNQVVEIVQNEFPEGKVPSIGAMGMMLQIELEKRFGSGTK